MPAKPATKKAAAPAKSAGTPSNGIYVGPIDVRNQTADEVRTRFGAYGKVQQLRLKRTLKVGRGPYALIWYKSTDDAKKAFNELKKNEPEGTNVEWIKAAKPVESRTAVASSIVINPVNIPPRNSQGYGKLQKKVREQFPNSVKTRLLREKNGSGTVLVYFKSNADAQAAKKALNGTLFSRPVTVRPSHRNLEKDKKRFVAPLEARKQYQVALAKKEAERKAQKEAKDLAVIKDKEMKAAALKKQLEAAKERAHDRQKAALSKAAPDAQVKHAKAPKEAAKQSHGAPSKVPPAKTAAKQPRGGEKTVSKKAQRK